MCEVRATAAQEMSSAVWCVGLLLSVIEYPTSTFHRKGYKMCLSYDPPVHTEILYFKL
jgi:hypothetical protein